MHPSRPVLRRRISVLLFGVGVCVLWAAFHRLLPCSTSAAHQPSRTTTPDGQDKKTPPPSGLHHIPADTSHAPLKLDPFEERFPWQPKELRSVLGTHRGRHHDTISCLCYSLDGTILASSGTDGVVQLWDAKTMLPVSRLPGHTERDSTIAFSRDGKLLATGSSDALRLWDLSEEKPRQRAVIRNALKPTCGDLALSFSADGKSLWGASHDEVRVWTIAQDAVQERAHLNPPGLISAGYGFSRGATRFAGAYRLEGLCNSRVGLWEIAGDKLMFHSTFVEPKEINVGSVFSPNGKLLATIPLGHGQDPSLHLWDVEPNPPRLIAEIPNGASSYYAQAHAISPDNRWLARGGEPNAKTGVGPQCVELIDLKGRPIGTSIFLAGWGTAPVTAVTFSPDGKTLAAGMQDGTIQLWAVQGDNVVPRPYPGSSFFATWLAISPAAEVVAVGSADGSARVFEQERGLWLDRGRLPDARAAAFSPDGTVLALAGRGSTRLWDFRAGKLTERPGPLPGVDSATRVVFAPDGCSLAIGGTNGEIRVWSLTGPNHLLRGLASPVGDIAFRSQSNELVVLHPEKQLMVTWDLISGSKARSNAFPKEVSAAILSPSGTEVFACDHAGQPLQLTVTAEGLALSSWLKDRPAGTDPVPLRGDQGAVCCLAVDRPGKRWALTGNGKRTAVWDTKDGEIHCSWDHCGVITGMAFTPDGGHVLTVNSNGTVYVLAVPR